MSIPVRQKVWHEQQRSFAIINHGRTLLLNVSGISAGNTGELGENFIPPDFRALALPPHTQQLRRRVFGVQPDRPYMNYRTQQLLNMIHATELEEFLLELDSRITYRCNSAEMFYLPMTTSPGVTILDDPLSPDPMGRSNLSYRIDALSLTSVRVRRLQSKRSENVQTIVIDRGMSSDIDLVGSGLRARLTLPMDDLQCKLSYDLYHYEELEIVDWNMEIQITTTDDPGFAAPVVETSTAIDQANWSYKLVGPSFPNNPEEDVSADGITTDRWESYVDDDYRAAQVWYTVPPDQLEAGVSYLVRWRQIAADPGDWTAAVTITYANFVGRTWYIDGNLRPQRTLGQLDEDLHAAPLSTVQAVFGVGRVPGTREPYKTFRKLWQLHPHTAYRLGGLILAMIYRSEEIRQHG